MSAPRVYRSYSLVNAYVLADNAEGKAQWLSPLAGSERQEAIAVTRRACRRRCSVEIHCRSAAAPFLPGRHDGFHFVAGGRGDLAHNLLKHLDPVPYLAQPHVRL